MAGDEFKPFVVGLGGVLATWCMLGFAALVDCHEEDIDEIRARRVWLQDAEKVTEVVEGKPIVAYGTVRNEALERRTPVLGHRGVAAYDAQVLYVSEEEETDNEGFTDTTHHRYQVFHERYAPDHFRVDTPNGLVVFPGKLWNPQYRESRNSDLPERLRTRVVEPRGVRGRFSHYALEETSIRPGDEMFVVGAVEAVPGESRPEGAGILVGPDARGRFEADTGSPEARLAELDKEIARSERIGQLMRIVGYFCMAMIFGIVMVWARIVSPRGPRKRLPKALSLEVPKGRQVDSVDLGAWLALVVKPRLRLLRAGTSFGVFALVVTLYPAIHGLRVLGGTMAWMAIVVAAAAVLFVVWWLWRDRTVAVVAHKGGEFFAWYGGKEIDTGENRSLRIDVADPSTRDNPRASITHGDKLLVRIEDYSLADVQVLGHFAERVGGVHRRG